MIKAKKTQDIARGLRDTRAILSKNKERGKIEEDGSLLQY
jgi:hypothetical protein